MAERIRNCIVSPAIENSPSSFFPHPLSILIIGPPLLKEKWDVVCLAFVADIINPLRVHKPGAGTTLSSYNDPLDAMQEIGI
jgi:hypothetical protein